MSSALRAAIPLLILVVGVAGYVVLVMPRSAEQQDESEDVAPTVETTELAVHGNGLDINVDGVVVPYREITMAAEVAGRVTMKAEVARAGNYVAKGTVLLEVDPRDYDLGVKQLRQELEQADSSLNELDVEVQNYRDISRVAEEQLNLHTVEYERQQKLAERRVVTATQLDQARQSVLQSQSQLMELRKQIQMLQARRIRLESVKIAMQFRLETAQLDLDRTRVVAPSDGVVVRDFVEVDSFVSKGTQLFVFEDTSNVEVRCNLQMDELYWLWLQQDNGASVGDETSAESQSRRDYQAP
ncbi:MAG: hypothetical protein U1E05_04270, partial [Patescibacteria group bacterium]|nr:hypothetical protein [Patescibacteria group bacterium]